MTVIFVLSWDGYRREFGAFDPAWQKLYSELMWLWEDYQDECSSAALETIGGWDVFSDFPLEVTAGVPASVYRIDKRTI